LDRLEEARLRDSYLKAKEIFEKIKSSQRTLQGLSFFTEEERNSWWEWQTEMERVKETENYLQEKAGVIQEELQKTEETLKKAEREFKELERKKERINQGLRLELENYERDEQACQRKEANAKEINKLIKIALVASGLTALAYIVHPVKVISVPLIGGILLAGFLFILFLKANWCRSRVDQLWISLQKESSLTGIPASSPKELWEKFAFIDESWRQKANILNDLRVKDKHLRTNLEEIEKKELTEIKQKLKEFQRKIEEVKLRSRVESLEIYSQNLKQKQEIENRLKVWRNSLAHIFPGQEKGKEDKLLFWGEKLKKLEVYKEKARGIDFNEKKREEEKNRKDNLRLKIEEIRQQMKTFRKELSEVEREINSLELENEFIPVETMVDLRAVEEKLVNFRVELDRQTEAVLDTLKVFEEIEAEEKSKIAALFGKKSPVSEIFFMVTKGRYNQVVFDQETETIKVALNNEEWLLADQLSAGAYDQLYFSIRLALGKILLENEKGFFILDDPFIKADPRRLETQMNVLRQIVNQGWQVLYFSAKGEIKECLKKDIEKTFVRLFQV
ncbi:MAG: ATP-binding protein, partial [Acidobacteriota bacterium]